MFWNTSLLFPLQTVLSFMFPPRSMLQFVLQQAVVHRTQSDNSDARSADRTSSPRSGCWVTKSQDGKKWSWWYHPQNVPVETGREPPR